MADNSEDAYEWREVSSERFEGDLDEIELYYATQAKLYEGTGHSFFAITGHLEVSLVSSLSESAVNVEQRVETAFREAWKRLRFDHPTIASFMEYDPVRKKCRKVYESFKSGHQGKSESDWLESSFKIVENGLSGLNFANADPPVQRHATLYLITPPTRAVAPPSDTTRRDIVFRCPHVTIDGIGTIILLDNLIAHAAEAYNSQVACPGFKPEQEICNLSPPLRIAAAIPKASPVQLDRFAQTHAAETALRKGVEPLGIPFDRSALLPRESRRVAVHMKGTEARALTKRCRALRLSVTHAFHAGIVLATCNTLEKKDQETARRYIKYCLINLREQCVPPYNSTRHAASAYHSIPGTMFVIDVTIPAKNSPWDSRSSSDFSSIVTQIKKYYLSAKSDLDFAAMIPLVIESLTPPYPEELYCEVPPPNQSPSVSISSMKVIDKISQSERPPFTVNAPWVTGDEYGTDVGVF